MSKVTYYPAYATKKQANTAYSETLTVDARRVDRLSTLPRPVFPVFPTEDGRQEHTKYAQIETIATERVTDVTCQSSVRKHVAKAHGKRQSVGTNRITVDGHKPKGTRDYKFRTTSKVVDNLYSGLSRKEKRNLRAANHKKQLKIQAKLNKEIQHKNAKDVRSEHLRRIEKDIDKKDAPRTW
jgi:hypothetical protein